VVAFLAAQVVVAASFAPWAVYRDGARVSGVSQGDGIVALVLGVATAVLAALVVVGARGRWVKLSLCGAGFALATVAVINRVQIDRADHPATNIRVEPGAGLWAVGMASFVVIVAALFEETPWSDDPLDPRSAG